MEVIEPETDANNKGIRDAIVRSKLKISMVTIIAAIGALKIVAIAPAVAQEISRMRVL